MRQIHRSTRSENLPLDRLHSNCHSSTNYMTFIHYSCVNKSNTNKICSLDKNKFRSIEIQSNPEIINNAFKTARWMWSCQIDGEFHHRTVALHKSSRWMFGFVIRWRHIVRYNMRWIVIGRWANVCLLFSSIDLIEQKSVVLVPCETV